MQVELNNELLSKNFKEIEKEIIQFFTEIGHKLNLNLKATEIFAYFKIYGCLTQGQLKQLTNFSSSTISTTLQLFLNLGTISKEIQLNSRKKLYRLKNEELVYTPFTMIIEELEKLDSIIVNIQDESLRYQILHPIFVDFFIKCLNNIRNYIEAQRRAINNEKRFSFFSEDVSKLIPSPELVNYPSELLKLEERIASILTNGNIYANNDPISNKILAYFFTRKRINQENLIHLTGFSRSTISRYLQQAVDNGIIRILPKEYKKSIIYYLDSVSLSLIIEILKTDNFIFSWIPKFESLIEALQTDTRYTSNKTLSDLLQARIKIILKQIDELKIGSKLLEQAQIELQIFLDK